MNKIVCIANDFWVDSDEKWGLNLLRENGYELELWRVGGVTLNFSIFEKLEFRYPVKTIKTWQEYYFLLMHQHMKKTIFLFYGRHVSLNPSMAVICLLGGKYCVIEWTSANNTRYAILNERKVRGIEKHWMDHFLPTYSFLGSKHNMLTMNSNFQIQHGNNVFLHTYDYDVFLKNKYYGNTGLDIDITQPYILFIDQNFFDHKEQVNLSLKKWIPDEAQFILEMKRFLDEVERQFQIPVVIAAHPVTCKRIKEIYGDRQIVYGNTCGYTANAEFVITSSSGAVGFAVMYKKPLLLYNNYQLKRNFFYMELQMPKARILNARIVNISNGVNSVDLKEYITDPNGKEYLEYITADAGNTELFMVTVLRYLNTL